jgi:CRISPR-associated protein Cmr6
MPADQAPPRAEAPPRLQGGGRLKTPLLDSLRRPIEPGIHPAQESGRPPQESGRVPMEYRAQVRGRCERQYIQKPKDAPPGWRRDIQIWIDEWVERTDRASPFTQTGLRLVEAQIDWRLISNSGVDEGIIRPVIGAGGWPLIPGSGIKGLFRRACPPQRRQRWCGSPCAAGDLSPGILRFHGAWPADDNWTGRLLDLAHPQQNWQVGFSHGHESHSAFGVVSLYKPRLQIGLSCSDPSITPGEWEEIEDTLRRALRAGIGGRTCVGYGSSGRLGGDLLFACALEGQGPAAKLLDDTPEFRPTMFRAAIRGMALRLFGGLTDASTALQSVGHLFGSLSRDEGQNVGLLATTYADADVRLDSYGSSSWKQPIYATSGQLQWRLTRSPETEEARALLAELLAALHGLTMSLGGFGKSWRRPDHRIFWPDYGKTPIGCHWQWREVQKLPAWIDVQSAPDLSQLLQRSRRVAARWLQAAGQPSTGSAPWRELIDPRQMQIWTRHAEDSSDAEAIHWFHRPRDRQPQRDARDLRKTDLAGKVNQVGLIWNRMLPIRAAGSSAPPSAAVRSPAPLSQPGAAIARPGHPTARSVAATMARPPSMARQASPARRDEVSIAAHAGAYLEVLVLHRPPRNAPPETRQHHQRLSRDLDAGAGADFQRLSW